MAEVKLYINNQQVLPEIAADMMTMLGFEDTEETTYLDLFSRNKKEVRHGPIVGKYAAYYGDENVFITVSRNRNLLVFIKNDLIGGDANYDYSVKMYTFSSILTELDVDLIGLKCRKEGEDLHITYWEFEDEIVDIYISIDL